MEEDPLLITLLGIAGGLCLYAFVVSTITDNYSQVDKYWSFTPAIYAWVCWSVRPTIRGGVAAVLISVWAARLSYNFYRKGGYSGVEDYRWAYIRKWFPNALLWSLFNFFFISFAQNLVLLAFSLPAYIITLYPTVPITPWDYAAYATMAGFIGLEAVADQQQWRFQSQKAKYRGISKPVPEAFSQGFLSTGLWSYSRHPNFFSEISLWWTFHLFSLITSQQYFHWSAIGPILLTALFHGSTNLTEEISAGKYEKYREYQKTTSRIVPWLKHTPKSD